MNTKVIQQAVHGNCTKKEKLKVGDVIRVEDCNEFRFALSVNGHLKGNSALGLGIDEVSDLIVQKED